MEMDCDNDNEEGPCPTVGPTSTSSGASATVTVASSEEPAEAEPGTGTSSTNTKCGGLGLVTSKNSILVSPRQRGNPVLKFIRSVPWEFEEIIPDYVMGPTMCALFISVRYHNLHPDYIHQRLKELKKAFSLRVLLVQMDVPDPYPIIKTLTHISLLADLTLIPVNSPEEAGRILENYKIYENKPTDFIQEKQDPNAFQQVIDALTTIRSVNKTDAQTLLSNFGSLAGIVEASAETIALCPGFGANKATRIWNALHETFRLENH